MAKMKFNNERIQKVRNIIIRLAESGLKVNQVINTYKSFVLPGLDYVMMNSILSLMELEKVGFFVSNKINELI